MILARHEDEMDIAEEWVSGRCYLLRVDMS